MDEQKKKLHVVLKEVESWDIDDKAKFFEKISENVPIGIRLIFDRKDILESEKIEALKLINKFQLEMNKIKCISS